MSDTVTGAEAQQDDGEGGSSGGRSFFGRLLNAFSTAETVGEDRAEPEPRGAMAGLGALARVRVDDVAMPKSEIVAVPVDITREALTAVFTESGFSRLPVYEDSLDAPLGLVHLKDFVRIQYFTPDPPPLDLRAMLRPLLFVPPSMPIGVLLQKMKAERRHMALVIDEYGGVDGLVTIEDLIEEVLGEIEDEHDEEEGGFWTEERPGQYLVSARTPLEDFEAEIGWRLDHPEIDEVDTLGGLAVMLSGQVPERGAVLQMQDGTRLEVVEADLRRIKRLRVILPEGGR